MHLKIMAPGRARRRLGSDRALDAAGADRGRASAKSVQVINVAGAGGTVGLAQFVNGAKGDGNQLMVNGFVMVGALLMNKSPVTLDQVTPIARLTEETQVMVVPANSPIKNAKDLAAAVKADVAKVTFAGGSAGGVDHIMAALFAGGDRRRRQAKVNYIPFSGGGESLAAILGGKVTAGISGLGEYEGQIKAGKLRAIGVTLAAAAARRRRADLQGTGHRSRAHQLALGGGGSRHHGGTAQDPERRGGEDGEVRRLEGHPQAEGLGRRLSCRRRVRGVPQAGTDARDRGPEGHRTGEI